MAVKIDLIKQAIELVKILPNSFVKIWLTFLTICVITLSTILLKDGGLKQYLINKIMSFYKAQNIAQSFNHNIQTIMDKMILKAEEKLKGEGECLFEYIGIQSAGVSQKNYFGYVMFSRAFDRELKKPVEKREAYLSKTLRDIAYGVSYSMYMDDDAKKNPFGTVKEVSVLVGRDSQNHTIMENTFTKKDGKYTGNFIFPVYGLGYSYLIDSNGIIIGHPVILCDEKAFKILGYDFLLRLIQEFHAEIVNYANSDLSFAENKNIK